MSDEPIADEQATIVTEGEKREQSTIAFPYHDLDAAIEVGRALYNRSGLGSCDLDELAAEMGQVISGTFRVKVGAARTFGLIEKDGRTAVKLSGLGRSIINGDDAVSAKVDAFMEVPLYSRLYEAYKGQKLPPMKALEREMAALGVSPKQTDKARQAFERSAKQAGFFDAGSDRLVRPRVDVRVGEQRPSAYEQANGASDEQNLPRSQSEQQPDQLEAKSPGRTFHPLIEGLLVTLPEVGQPWSEADRRSWLTMAESIFAMIYSKRPEPNTATGP